MKRTDLKKHAAALLLVLCLLVTSALPALATSANIKLVDSSGNPTTGTIRVTLYDSANDKALSGGKLTLYRVAEVKRQNGNLSYEYCGDFYGCGIALGDLTDSTLAAQLQEYLPQSAEGTTKTIDADGNVTFCGLELGLYLIVQTEASKGYEPINPFLVSLPMAEDGKWNYAVDASPKVGAYAPTKPDTPPTPPTPPTPDYPDTPTPPDNPDNPVSPGNPDNPVAPGHPDNPVAPGHPDHPVAPGNPDSPVLSYTKMAFHDGKVCIVQLTRIVEIVRIKGGTGNTGQIGGDTDCIRKMVTNNIVDIVSRLHQDDLPPSSFQRVGKLEDFIFVSDGIQRQFRHIVTFAGVTTDSR